MKFVKLAVGAVVLSIATLSLAAWVGVIIFGRLIPYLE